ncbi:hypothetical protein DEU37_1601 [Microbacterium sp. AG790]|nr:hypothetical protein DEU37_1601 [Microbacterium sp. AG790]
MFEPSYVAERVFDSLRRYEFVPKANEGKGFIKEVPRGRPIVCYKLLLRQRRKALVSLINAPLLKPIPVVPVVVREEDLGRADSEWVAHAVDQRVMFAEVVKFQVQDGVA